MKYNLAILGGGPAGYTAAERAAAGGWSVVLFEKDSLGGVCLNKGCIPTKTLLYSAKRYAQAKDGAKYGVSAENVSFEYAKIVQRKQKVVRKLVAGIKSRMHGVDVVQAEAEVVSRTDDTVVLRAADNNYEADNLLICTGSEDFVPPIPGVQNNQHVWSSADALEAKELPASVVIVGGGVIGMEFATLYNELGVEVTIVEYQPEILPNIDSEITAMLHSIYEKRGVHILTSAKVEAVEGDKVLYSQVGTTAGAFVRGEKILISVGRRPVIKGLEALSDMEFEGRGIKVNEFMQTNLKNVYAAGDVTGKIMLAHVASRQAEVAVGRMLKQIPLQRIAYNAVPAVVYTNPEIAVVGLSEADFKGKDCVLPMEVEVKKLPMTYSGRFVAENEGETGLCKLVVDKKSNTILGVQLFGTPASEIIGAASVAVRFGYTVSEWKQVIMPHPTVSEILKEALYSEN